MARIPSCAWYPILAVTFWGCDNSKTRAGASETPNAPSVDTSQKSGMRSPFAPKPEGPTLGPAPEIHAPKTKATARDYTMTVLGAGPCEVEAPFRPKPGTIKLGVDVEIVASSKHQVPANPLYAKLADAEKQTYSATLAGCNPMLKATRLVAGEQARGLITFDVPADAKGLVMTYAPFIVGSGAQELRFSLGR